MFAKVSEAFARKEVAKTPARRCLTTKRPPPRSYFLRSLPPPPVPRMSSKTTKTKSGQAPTSSSIKAGLKRAHKTVPPHNNSKQAPSSTSQSSYAVPVSHLRVSQPVKKHPNGRSQGESNNIDLAPPLTKNHVDNSEHYDNFSKNVDTEGTEETLETLEANLAAINEAVSNLLHDVDSMSIEDSSEEFSKVRLEILRDAELCKEESQRIQTELGQMQNLKPFTSARDASLQSGKMTTEAHRSAPGETSRAIHFAKNQTLKGSYLNSIRSVQEKALFKGRSSFQKASEAFKYSQNSSSLSQQSHVKPYSGNTGSRNMNAGQNNDIDSHRRQTNTANVSSPQIPPDKRITIDLGNMSITIDPKNNEDSYPLPNFGSSYPTRVAVETSAASIPREERRVGGATTSKYFPPPDKGDSHMDHEKPRAKEVGNSEVVRALDEFGEPYRAHGGEYVLQECPFCHATHGDPSNMYKLYVHSTIGMFKCFRCGAAGGFNKLKAKFQEKKHLY